MMNSAKHDSGFRRSTLFSRSGTRNASIKFFIEPEIPELAKSFSSELESEFGLIRL